MSKNVDFRNGNKDIFTILFLIIPFFRPDFISRLMGDSVFNKIFIAWRVVSFSYMILLNLHKKNKKALDMNLLIIILYQLVCLISCIKNHVSPYGRLINLSNSVGIYMIYSHYVNKCPEIFIKANYYLFSFLIITNSVLTIMYPNGLNNADYESNRINFLGGDNGITTTFFMTLIFCILYLNVFPKKRMPIFVIITIYITEFYYHSGSGLVSLVFLLAYIIFVSKNKLIEKVLNINVVLATYLVLEYIVVFMARIDFLDFIFKILDKSSTFTDRRFYWNHAIAQFNNNKLLGQGHGIVDLWDNGYYSHNAFLDVLLKGGIIGSVLWIAMIFVMMKNKKSERSYIYNIIIGFLCAFFAVGFMEGLEDGIAFNAFLALASVIYIFEDKEIFHKKVY